MAKRIESRPTDGLSYNSTEAKYWDRAELDKEVERVFDICHGCRLCFNLCPSFPALFDAVDRNDGDVRALTGDETQRVIDLCYGCKLCEVKCPYTPHDGHEFQLDFPRLITRAKAVNAKEHGVPLRERVLGHPDQIGKVGTLTPRLANWGCHQKFQRVVMEKMLGIHRDKLLPDFADETFDKWLERNPLPPPPAEPTAKVAVFPTCFVNYYNPAPGKAAVEVFAKNGCAVKCPKQNCCGMPALDSGDIEFARKEARTNVDSMLPLVRQGYKIAAINPTCSLMMRLEYPKLLAGDEVKEFAAAIVDSHELLYQLRRAGKFNTEFQSTPGTVAYHVPCHLKAQDIGLRSRDLMRQIPGVEVTTVDACTAHDGTWAMKKEFFAISMKWGEKAFSGMRDASARVMATDCPLAAVQIEQATGVHPMHPIEVLARAYKRGGFPDAVPQPEPPQGRMTMKKISPDEILALADYERVRSRLRPLFIHEKERRRLHVGSHLTFIFENAQTEWYQIEEMIRSEKMTDREAIQHEIDTYNELIPAPGELVATLLIEYAEAAERDAALARLVGLENHLWLKIGTKRIAARFDERQVSDEKVSAVQFVRFALEDVDAARFMELAGSGEVAVEADHPSLAARGEISGLLAASLAEDLR